MIKIAICDDDPTMCYQLHQLISQKLDSLNTAHTITCYANAARLLAIPLDFDLLFLDIQMPGIGGISLAKTLRQQNFTGAIVFITILKDYMLDAFEVEAADYLCKPIDEVRLENTLRRILKRKKIFNEKRFFIHTMNWCRSVFLCDIYYCEVINRKIYLHTKDGIVEYYGKLKEAEKQLDEHFIKCHRSYIINLSFLKEYANSQVLLENGSRIPVSRPYHQILLAAMLQYMERSN
ncbi:MAG: response regulator transcription factor [Lachnospiraceae bacterium]|jgi:two-component system response regulator LytT|nr:response regulator transcription factor [Lachnospiraceae bacterium]